MFKSYYVITKGHGHSQTSRVKIVRIAIDCGRLFHKFYAMCIYISKSVKMSLGRDSPGHCHNNSLLFILGSFIY